MPLFGAVFSEAFCKGPAFMDCLVPYQMKVAAFPAWAQPFCHTQVLGSSSGVAKGGSGHYVLNGGSLKLSESRSLRQGGGQEEKSFSGLQSGLVDLLLLKPYKCSFSGL